MTEMNSNKMMYLVRQPNGSIIKTETPPTPTRKTFYEKNKKGEKIQNEEGQPRFCAGFDPYFCENLVTYSGTYVNGIDNVCPHCQETQKKWIQEWCPNVAHKRQMRGYEDSIHRFLESRGVKDTRTKENCDGCRKKFYKKNMVKTNNDFDDRYCAGCYTDPSKHIPLTEQPANPCADCAKHMKPIDICYSPDDRRICCDCFDEKYVECSNCGLKCDKNIAEEGKCLACWEESMTEKYVSQLKEFVAKKKALLKK